MFWDFFKKGKNGVDPGDPKAGRATKPKELPAPIGRDLVVKLGLDPDWVWNLRCVVRPSLAHKNRVDVRVFSPTAAAARGARIGDYDSVLEYPGLVLFEGWYDKKNADALVTPVEKPGPIPLARAA